MSLEARIRELGERAQAASHELSLWPARRKNRVLRAMASAVEGSGSESERTPSAAGLRLRMRDQDSRSEPTSAPGPFSTGAWRAGRSCFSAGWSGSKPYARR